MFVSSREIDSHLFAYIILFLLVKKGWEKKQKKKLRPSTAESLRKGIKPF